MENPDLSPKPTPHTASDSEALASVPVSNTALQDRVIAVLRTCYDPEIPVNIYDLGLVYDVKVDANNAVNVKMTLTSPNCPVAGTLPPEVQAKVGIVEGVTAARVDVVWDPPWSPAKMSEAAKLELGMM